MELSNFDLSKENIQPLRGGRNVTQLGAALQAESDVEYQKELIHQKEAFETAIRTYEGVDPLENWYQYISWVEQSYPKHGHEGNLYTLLEKCLREFEHDDRYRQDRRLCKLWIKYLDMQENRLELFQLLYSMGVGTECSDLYKAWAYYYEEAGNFKRADKIFQLGIQANAQPQDDLVHAHQNLLFAIANNFLRGEVDTEELAEKRMALTSLRTFKHRTMVGSYRVGSSIKDPMPGKLKTVGTIKPGCNARVEIFEDFDSNPGPSTGGKLKSILDSASKRDTVRKENTLKPGVWSDVKSKKSIVPLDAKTNLQFTVHEDASESREAFRYPPNFTSTTKDDFSNFYNALYIPDPDNQNMRFETKLNEIYRDDTEYSFEELLKQKWLQKRHSANNDTDAVLIDHDTPIVLAREDGSIVHVEDIHRARPRDVADGRYATTPLKMQLAVLKVSSPHDVRSDRHVVSNLTRVFDNSPGYQSPKCDSSRNAPDEVAKAVESIVDGPTPKQAWPLEPVCQPDTSVTVHTRNAIQEMNALWSCADPVSEIQKKEPLTFQLLDTPTAHPITRSLFSIYSDTDHYRDENDHIDAEKNMLDNVGSHRPDFPIYSDVNDYRNENRAIVHDTSNYIDKSVAYAVGQTLYDVNRQQIHDTDNRASLERESIGHDVVPRYPPAGADYADKFYVYNDPQGVRLEDTCSTQAFNFNINDASTPYNMQKTHAYHSQYHDPHAMYQQQQEAYGHHHHHSVQQELFPIYDAAANAIPDGREIVRSDYPPPEHHASYVHPGPNGQYASPMKKTPTKLLSTILETTEYKSSLSGSTNGTSLKTLSGATDALPTIHEVSDPTNRDAYKMEYEIGQAMLQLSQEIPQLDHEIPHQKFEIFSDEPNVNYRRDEYNEMYIDQNSKNSTDTVEMAPPKIVQDDFEKMDWDEHFAVDRYRNYETLVDSNKPIDPFSSKVIECLLKKVRFPNRNHSDRYEKVSTIPKLTLKETISFRSDKYTVTKVLGKGTFGTVVKATNLNNNDTVALKYQKPANFWEYYICCEIRHRINDPNLLLSYTDIHKAFFSKTASLYQSDFSKYGSLLNVANKVKKSTGKPMKELLIYHFAAEIIYIISGLHECQIIHADIKPDNFLVMRMPPENGKPSIQLIDFGCSIDMKVLPAGTRFYKVITTEDFTCTEMREGRPWTYQTDYYCIAATIYVLLIGEYMQVQKKGDVWSITKKLPRYLNHDLWNVFFMQMLNIESCDALPNLMTIQSQFQSILNEKHREIMTELKLLANIISGR